MISIFNKLCLKSRGKIPLCTSLPTPMECSSVQIFPPKHCASLASGPSDSLHTCIRPPESPPGPRCHALIGRLTPIYLEARLPSIGCNWWTNGGSAAAAAAVPNAQCRPGSAVRAQLAVSEECGDTSRYLYDVLGPRREDSGEFDIHRDRQR